MIGGVSVDRPGRYMFDGTFVGDEGACDFAGSFIAPLAGRYSLRLDDGRLECRLGRVAPDPNPFPPLSLFRFGGSGAHKVASR